jgi:hypothetical protein
MMTVHAGLEMLFWGYANLGPIPNTWLCGMTMPLKLSSWWVVA